MSRSDGAILVLGIGNLLLCDEGVGIRLVEDLGAAVDEPLPPDVKLVDGGTLGLDLLPQVEDARALVLLDAIDAGSVPGSVIVLRGSEIEGTLGGRMSVHQVGVSDLVSVARLRGTLPAHTSLIGVQPADLGVGLGLSPAVNDALPGVLRAVRAEIATLAAMSQPGS